MSWYIPATLRAALAEHVEAEETSLQSIVTAACEAHYGNPRNPDIPPLVPPTPTKSGGHTAFTWYAPEELHTSIKVLAANIRSSAQQRITSAVVHSCRRARPIAALNIQSGVAPQARNTETSPPLLGKARTRSPR